MPSEAVDQWLRAFPLDTWIKAHIAAVIENLPPEVRSDFLDDPEFIVHDYDPGPHVILQVPVRFTNNGKPGRSIVIKRTIKRRPIPFVRWVIAHELAHAYLRHEGRGTIQDPEHAADSLAAEWGFPKPEMS
jgi:hypothetical protein